jgi:hypothetical protein
VDPEPLESLETAYASDTNELSTEAAHEVLLTEVVQIDMNANDVLGRPRKILIRIVVPIAGGVGLNLRQISVENGI